MIKLVVKDKQAHNPDKKMSLMAHLLELRKRIIWALVGIVVGSHCRLVSQPCGPHLHSEATYEH